MSTKTEIRRYIALYDIHCGFELRAEGAKRVKRPTHSEAALRAALRFARDFSPTHFILGGDQLDIGAISFHNHGKPRLVEGLRLTDDYDALNECVLKELDQSWAEAATKVWLTGNHENRVGRYLDAHPGAEGLIEPEVYLGLKARGWRLQPEEAPYRIGKLHFVHGHACFPRGGCKDPASKLAHFYRRSVRCGHLHQYAAATDITPADRRDYHSAIVVPAMCRSNPGYAGNASDNFMQGFAWGYVLPDGSFTDYVTCINNGRFAALGKVYDGNKK